MKDRKNDDETHSFFFFAGTGKKKLTFSLSDSLSLSLSGLPPHTPHGAKYWYRKKEKSRKSTRHDAPREAVKVPSDAAGAGGRQQPRGLLLELERQVHPDAAPGLAR